MPPFLSLDCIAATLPSHRIITLHKTTIFSIYSFVYTFIFPIPSVIHNDLFLLWSFEACGPRHGWSPQLAARTSTSAAMPRMWPTWRRVGWSKDGGFDMFDSTRWKGMGWWTCFECRYTSLRCICRDPNDKVDGIGTYVICLLVSRFIPGLPCPAGHWFPHCPVSTTKATQMAVSTCNLPRNACRRLLEKKILADAYCDVRSLFILDTNPFTRKCQKWDSTVDASQSFEKDWLHVPNLPKQKNTS